MDDHERARLRDKIRANHERRDGSACWEWQRARNRKGYGHMRWGGKVHGAHRLAYEAFVGPVEDLHVLHCCDNPRCVNPDHLFLGTHADNMADKMAKGRARGGRLCGEAHSQAKLTEADVIEIRSRLALGHTQHAIAADLGVSQKLVSQIKLGRCWGHV